MGNFGGRRSFSGRAGSGFARGGNRDGFNRGRSSFSRDDRPREMFDAICDNCGKSCQVPFRPTQGKPVYCSDCFEQMNPRDNRNDRNDRNDRPNFAESSRGRSDNQNKLQFDSLNAKLDKIISLLEPKIKKTVKKVTPPKET